MSVARYIAREALYFAWTTQTQLTKPKWSLLRQSLKKIALSASTAVPEGLADAASASVSAATTDSPPLDDGTCVQMPACHPASGIDLAGGLQTKIMELCQAVNVAVPLRSFLQACSAALLSSSMQSNLFVGQAPSLDGPRRQQLPVDRALVVSARRTESHKNTTANIDPSRH